MTMTNQAKTIARLLLRLVRCGLVRNQRLRPVQVNRPIDVLGGNLCKLDLDGLELRPETIIAPARHCHKKIESKKKSVHVPMHSLCAKTKVVAKRFRRGRREIRAITGNKKSFKKTMNSPGSRHTAPHTRRLLEREREREQLRRGEAQQQPHSQNLALNKSQQNKHV